jgi:hypothetical protein
MLANSKHVMYGGKFFWAIVNFRTDTEMRSGIHEMWHYVPFLSSLDHKSKLQAKNPHSQQLVKRGT